MISCIRDIREGEEILISYMDISLHDDGVALHAELLRRYLFQCSCDK